MHNCDDQWIELLDYKNAVSRNCIDRVNHFLFSEDNCPKDISEIDVCIILGSNNCIYKVKKAIDVFSNNRKIIFVASGGNISQSNVVEAIWMKEVLLRNNISRERILVDDKSKNTKENIVNSMKNIEKHFDDSSNANIAIIVAGFHRRRVKFYATTEIKNELYLINAYGDYTKPDNWYKSEIGRKIIYDELKKVEWEYER